MPTDDLPGTVGVRVAGVLLVVAAVAYSGLPFEAAAGFPLDPMTAYLSELAARDQPSRPLFTVVDTVAGSAATLAAILLLRAHVVVRSHRSTWTPWIPTMLVLLLVFGVATVADVLNPMACAPSADVGCARAERSWELGTTHVVHLGTSGLATVAAVGVCVSLLVLLTRSRRHLPGARWWDVAPLSALVLSAVVAVIAVSDTFGVRPPAVGWWQRGQIIAFCVTVACIVPTLRRFPATPGAAVRTKEAPP